ncbi:hypothetical protein RGQ29_032082 [Quercus rubra]|uniref:Uncharacterized protein n=1 Tax=Quercus rubra TaxID=3512 RepID=A0AAN7I5A1_QUERU|nr:hypothetical protein RGQ29_032082 [Quercus rubra]
MAEGMLLASRSHHVKDWLEKLKDAVYEVDDLLGEFYTEALRRGGITGNITKKMSRKINAMKQKLNAIAEDRKMFHSKENHVEPPVSMEREQTHSFVLDEKVIGREDDKKAIIELLLEPNNEENVSIIPIVGIGGLGKTTLAQFVYNDKNIKEHFELKMWICISDIFDVELIIQKIILATGEEPVVHSMDKLRDQICKIIDQKKYLLVLDDVWNKDPHIWERLKDLLVGGAKGKITCPAPIYTLKGLNEEQSWLLFKQIAFRKGQGQGINNPRLDEIGREIVHKCQGVPLAIKSIGNVLRLEKTEHKWSYVKNNILEIATQQKNDIFPILKGELKYKMHDLIHDLAQLVVGAECTIITLDQNNFDEKTRHVSLPFYIASSFIETLDKTKLNKLILSCRRLRALGLCGMQIERVLDSIEKLRKLQTLKVNGCLNLKELPRDIRFLNDLRHLENSNCRGLRELQISNLRYLEDVYSEPSAANLRAKQYLDRLTLLWSTSTLDHQQHSHHQSLPSFHHLSVLDIRHCPNLTSLPPFPYLEEKALPEEWMSNLSFLKELSIEGGPKLKSLSLAMSHLTSLESLEIRDFVYLEISSSPNLTSIPDGISNLKSLEELYLDDCPNLKSLPDEMVSLKSLQKLVIDRYPDLAKKCEKGMGEDWFKIAYVPDIRIWNR